MNRRMILVVAAAAGLGLAGCGQQQNPVATGAATGTVLGAAAGQLVGGDTESTAAGALAGMGAGIATGAILEGQQARQRQCAVYRGGVRVGTQPC
jgi:hypothetical protein